MTARKLVWSKLKPEDIERFLSHLDQMPEAERPVYGVSGEKSSLWEKLGGGAKHLFALFFKDRVVISTRSMARNKEQMRQEWPMSDIADVHVTTGPLMSSVQIRFRDGSATKIANVRHEAAEPLNQLTSEGLSGLDRSQLSPVALTDFCITCNLVLPLPDDLFERGPT